MSVALTYGMEPIYIIGHSSDWVAVWRVMIRKYSAGGKSVTAATALAMIRPTTLWHWQKEATLFFKDL